MWFKKSSRQRSPTSLLSSTNSKVDLTAKQQYQAARLGLARRLHETLAQDLAAIGYQLDAVIAEESLTAEVRADLRNIRIKVMESAQNFRTEIYKLRKTDRLALHSNLIELLAGISLSIDLSFPLLDDQAEELLIEAVLEIAQNTRKHAAAKNFYLNYQMTDSGVDINVGDNGRGNLQLKAGSFGLLGIDEVLRQITEDYSCSSDDKGTHYRIFIDRKHFL